MKKIIWIIILIIGIGISGYFFCAKNNLENDVIEHVMVEKNIPKENIVSSKAFVANLPGVRNYMVSIKIENDTNTYFYYKNKNDEIILESYTDENGEEHVMD
ncbi:hypothetical protein [Oceanobacillus sp. J11TS1]|uniref:hypothetical protein n=1 Tax=Oceanobacillus sp. J11TS1 TaxID=2807191 RepID=UPI001B11413D|nr:hypothetical protein [Oceanobacillus sp. J11TS1]GIO21448.1 hypothetical protein J11TS1_00290 [Oceanobacillus sp. J11TS1]